MPEFPWAAFLEQQKRKQQQTQQAAQFFGNALQSVGDNVGQGLQKRNQRNSIQDFLSAQQQPIPGQVPQTASATGLPPKFPVASYDPNTDHASPGQMPGMVPNPNAKFFRGMEKLPPEMAAQIMGPMLLAQQKQGLKASAPLSKGMQAEIDMSNKKYAAGAPGTPKGRMLTGRGIQSETSALTAIENNIDPAVAKKTTPVGAAAQSVRRVFNGLTLLQQPIVTKTALEATAADIDSILTQASGTVEGRKMLSQTNAYQNFQQLKAQLSNAPDQVPVTPGLVRIYKGILRDLGPVSQNFVVDRVKQQAEMYRSRGEELAGPEQYNAMINRAVKGFTIPQNLMEDSAPQGSGGLSPQEMEEFKRLDAKYGGKQ